MAFCPMVKQVLGAGAGRRSRTRTTARRCRAAASSRSAVAIRRRLQSTHHTTAHTRVTPRQRPRRASFTRITTVRSWRSTLVSRRIEERAAGPHRVRAPVRAPDVRGLGALRPGLLPAAAGGRRHAQRLDQRRPHELLGSRADQRAGAGAVDGIRSHGLPAAGADRREVREPARRRAERAAAELREPALRLRRHGDRRGAVSARSSVSLADDRRGGRPARGRARRRARVLPDLLPPAQRVAGAGRRHRHRTTRSRSRSSYFG